MNSSFFPLADCLLTTIEAQPQYILLIFIGWFHSDPIILQCLKIIYMPLVNARNIVVAQFKSIFRFVGDAEKCASRISLHHQQNPFAAKPRDPCHEKAKALRS